MSPLKSGVNGAECSFLPLEDRDRGIGTGESHFHVAASLEPVFSGASM